jgi:hypothetical protein
MPSLILWMFNFLDLVKKGKEDKEGKEDEGE